MTRKQYISCDVRMEYDPVFSKSYFMDWLLKTEQYYLKRYLTFLRSEEYYTYIAPNKIKKYYWFRKKNILGAKLGFFIPAGCFGPDLKIAHYGSIIVNPHSKIGSGCTLHGNCCIGNKGIEGNDNDSPVIGDNVNIGQGAQVIGPVSVANDVIIAAGAIVVSSVSETGSVLVGIPAKAIKKVS